MIKARINKIINKIAEAEWKLLEGFIRKENEENRKILAKLSELE